MKVSTAIAAGTLLLIGSSCQTPDRVGFHAFTEKASWPNYEIIAAQKRELFKPDERDRATRYTELADRLDYCEAYGVSVNDAMRAIDRD